MSLSNLAKGKTKRKPSAYLSFDDEVDSSDVCYNAQQRELLELIKEQDVKGVRAFFARGPTFELSRHEIGKVALRLAIFNERTDIAEILLENGVRIGNALFSAVIEGSKECVELFLDKRFFNRLKGDIGPTDRQDGFFMSPLMLAVQLKDYDIIQYMVGEGFRIDRPEDADASEDEIQFLLHINSYRALANPLYMAYSYLYNQQSEHPIFTAFNLHETLDRKAKVDHEFKRDYGALSKGCEEFAVSLLEQCRTMDEIKILTDVQQEIVHKDTNKRETQYTEFCEETEEAKDLAFLNMAIRNNNTKLVAHPYSQLRLNIVLHNGISQFFCCKQTWRSSSLLSKAVYSICHTLLFPFLAMIYLVAPSLSLSVGLANPVVKFISHTGSFAVFLVLLICSAFQDQFNTGMDAPSILEWLVFLWVVGLAVQELKVFYYQGANLYRRQWWNLVSLLMITFFLLSYCFQIIAYGLVRSWAILDQFGKLVSSLGYQPILIANSLYTVGMVLSFFHISSAFQVNATFGPLQLSLYRLFRDVVKFLVFFALLFIAFGFSLRKLYSQYNSVLYQLAKVNGTSGQEHHFARVDKSLGSLFWSLFGLTDLDTFAIDKPEFGITQQTGVALFGFYQVLIVVIAFNMLIAMMSRSFETIVEEEDVHWKVSRTRMWMNWVNKGSVLPPPYNLIPNPTDLAYVIKRMKDKYQSQATPYVANNNNDKKSFKNWAEVSREEQDVLKINLSAAEDRRKYKREVLEQIVERYLHQVREESRQEDFENIKDIKNIQELMWQELGGHADGFPRSPLRRSFRAQKSVQITEETSL